MIEIDGSMGEGGGQILRSALAFSALLGVPVRIYNIRANRRPPGLKPNHLTTVKAIAEITNAKVEGLKLGSREIKFYPRTIRSGKFFFDIGTAGSIPLVLQAILPVLAFAPGRTEIKIRGGTAVPFSPPIHYLKFVFLEALRRMGVIANIEVKRMGYYPRGGGIVIARVDPVEFVRPIRLERLGNVRPRAFAFISNLPNRIVRDMISSASERIESEIHKRLEAERKRYEALDKGCGIVIYSIDEGIVGADQLCKKGVHARKIGSMAAEKFLDEVKADAGADKHLADHLIIRSSIAAGESIIKTSEITSHTRTQIDLLKIFLPDVPVRVLGNKIIIKGIELRRRERLTKRIFGSSAVHRCYASFMPHTNIGRRLLLYG